MTRLILIGCLSALLPTPAQADGPALETPGIAALATQDEAVPNESAPLGAAVPDGVLAGASPLDAPPAEESAPGPLRVLGALFASVAAVLVVAAFMRRGWGSRGLAPLAVESRIALSRASALAIVRAGERRLLIGITPSRIQLLCEMDGPPVPVEQES